MALEINRFAIPLKAKTNMSEKQYRAVKIASDNFSCDLAQNGLEVVGIVQNNPKEDMAASVVISGICKLAVADGATITQGYGVDVVNGEAVGFGNFGIALESATGPCLISVSLKSVPYIPSLITEVDDDIAIDLFGKTVSELQEDIQIESGTISGTLKYISDYSSAGYAGDEVSGNFLALHFDTGVEGTTYVVELMGGVHGPQTLDSDQVCIFRVTSNSQRIKVTASKDGYNSITQIYNLDLTLTPNA